MWFYKPSSGISYRLWAGLAQTVSTIREAHIEMHIADYTNKSNAITILDLWCKCQQLSEKVSKNRIVDVPWNLCSSLIPYVFRYEERCSRSHPLDRSILLGIARESGIGPVMMCRALLKVKYRITEKVELTQLLRSPHLIEDPQFSANVSQCVCSDSQDGPLIDLRRRVLGEEYEFKVILKNKS